MVAGLQGNRNARAVYLVDVNGNPIGSSSAPIVADTELPAAAALADATANPTAPAVASYGLGFNGTTWDRLRTKGTGWQGAVLVTSGGVEILGTGSSAASLGAGTLPLFIGEGYVYNGAAWDQQRNTNEATLLASAARTITQTSADIITYNATNLQVVLDMTVVGTGSVTVTINGKDSASGKYFLLLAGLAIITNSTNRYRVGPNLAVAANSVAQDYLPRIIQIVVTANNANPATYSVGTVLGV